MTGQWINLEQLQTQPLQNNLQALHVVDPEFLQNLQHDRLHEPLLFQQQGNVIRCRTKDEPSQWLFGESNPEQEQQQILEQLKQINPDSSLYILLGSSAGYVYAALQSLTKNNSSKRILIIEPNASRLWAMLALVDVSHELIQGRIHLKMGSPDTSSILPSIQKFGLWHETDIALFTAAETNHKVDTDSIKKLYLQEKQKQIESRHSQIELISQQETSNIIQRVLLVDCWVGRPGSVHLQSIDKVLQKRNVNTHVLPLNYQRINWHVEEYKRLNDTQFINALNSFQPDMVLSYGYHAPELVRRDVYDASNAKWVQVVTNLAYQPKEYFPNEYPVLVEEKLFPAFYKKGVQHPIFLPLVANEIAESPVQSNHSIPVVFVGNSFAMMPGDLQQFMTRVQKRSLLKDYLQRALNELSAFDNGLNLFEYLETQPPPQLDDEEDEYHIFRFLLSQATANRRRQVLESIADKGLLLFGGDWDRALPPNSPLRNCFKQFADEKTKTQLAELGFIFLNIHSVGNATCPNMRFFNTPGDGSFQISDHKNFAHFFEADQETVYYETRQELRDKIDYYVNHKTEANEIRLQGHEKAKSCWTYENWVDKLFKKLGVTFKNQ